jgi:hypothetical protein
MPTTRSRPSGAVKSYTQLATEFPNCKGYAMMADRERVMGVHPNPQLPPASGIPPVRARRLGDS